MKTNKIIKVDIPQTVKVRVYEVDTDGLKKILRQSKKNVGLSNKEISNILSLPITLVEHWFRTDNCFAIPDSNIWFDLKKLLQIKDDSFDKSIITFEERLGIYEKSERCYLDIGIAPTITAASADEKIITSCF